MNKTFILSELSDLYYALKRNEDFKYAASILKTIAQIQGYFLKSKEFDIKNLSDDDLKTLIERVEKVDSYGI